MAKSSPTNLCRRALNKGYLTCKGKDLLTEYQTWSKKLRITDVTNRCLDRKSIISPLFSNLMTGLPTWVSYALVYLLVLPGTVQQKAVLFVISNLAYTVKQIVGLIQIRAEMHRTSPLELGSSSRRSIFVLGYI